MPQQITSQPTISDQIGSDSQLQIDTCLQDSALTPPCSTSQEPHQQLQIPITGSQDKVFTVPGIAGYFVKTESTNKLEDVGLSFKIILLNTYIAFLYHFQF